MSGKTVTTRHKPLAAMFGAATPLKKARRWAAANLRASDALGGRKSGRVLHGQASSMHSIRRRTASVKGMASC